MATSTIFVSFASFVFKTYTHESPKAISKCLMTIHTPPGNHKKLMRLCYIVPEMEVSSIKWFRGDYSLSLPSLLVRVVNIY